MESCIGTLFFLVCRVSKQRLREATAQAVDYLILGLAGVCLGILAKSNDSNLGAAGYTYTIIAVCKLEMAHLSLHILNYYSNLLCFTLISLYDDRLSF